MIKVIFYDMDKSTVLDVVYYKDTQMDKMREEVADHGEEFTLMELDSRDCAGFAEHKHIKETLYKVCKRVMEQELKRVEEDARCAPLHQFSEEFERKMSALWSVETKGS